MGMWNKMRNFQVFVLESRKSVYLINASWQIIADVQDLWIETQWPTSKRAASFWRFFCRGVVIFSEFLICPVFLLRSFSEMRSTGSPLLRPVFTAIRMRHRHLEFVGVSFRSGQLIVLQHLPVEKIAHALCAKDAVSLFGLPIRAIQR